LAATDRIKKKVPNFYKGSLQTLPSLLAKQMETKRGYLWLHFEKSKKEEKQNFQDLKGMVMV
jgi:hypothetical protein